MSKSMLTAINLVSMSINLAHYPKDFRHCVGLVFATVMAEVGFGQPDGDGEEEDEVKFVSQTQLT